MVSAQHLVPHKGGDAAISVLGVSKEYAKFSLTGLLRRKREEPARALTDVSLSVREGEVIGLLGPNGAGKTTLLKIIATLLYPSAGKVLIHGRDIHEDPTWARGVMGLVTCDERSFFWRLSGRDNLLFFATLYGLPKRRGTERTETLLEALGLAFAADRPYHSYSSGMKQKLAIARGLLGEPSVILYDEPTRSLDPISAQNIRRLIIEMRSKMPRQTHLIATNQLDEAEQLCDRVFIINRGALIAHGSIQEIRERWHRQEYGIHRIWYSGCRLNGQIKPCGEIGLFEVNEEFSDTSGVLRLRTGKDSAALSYVLDKILRSGGRVIQCEAEPVPFDEVFCSLVLGDQKGEAGAGAGGGR